MQTAYSNKGSVLTQEFRRPADISKKGPSYSQLDIQYCL